MVDEKQNKKVYRIDAGNGMTYIGKFVGAVEIKEDEGDFKEDEGKIKEDKKDSQPQPPRILCFYLDDVVTLPTAELRESSGHANLLNRYETSKYRQRSLVVLGDKVVAYDRL